ncbi:MAG: 2-isopropylmalate synthase [Chloroflexi bacterium]|nr:2-isopropylmalate synthase [Chloroflexota bacterium]
MTDESTVLIFDTTLRDGEQAAGATMTGEQKVEIAHQLDRLGVDIIEAGFPISSPGELASVQRIATEVTRPIICALCHANNAAVDAARDSLKDAARPRIHVFLSTSEIHLLHQLRKDREEVLNLACENVARARGYCEDVEFSPMDATRSDPDYVHRLLEATIDAGASTVNIPDTVGYTTPEEFYQLIRGIVENVRNIHKARISVHCHNDLGMAVANSLAAVRAGARQIECTINGIGERAGNASLEEIVMALRTRVDTYELVTNIDSTQLIRASRLVSEHTGFAVQPNKAIVGKNAFRHASGIHQDGILKERTTYEIMDPASVGLAGTSLVLGKLSGRHAFRKRLEELGYQLTDDELARAFESFKEVAEKKKELSDLDLEALVADERRVISEAFSLDHMQVTCGNHETPTATVRLLDADGKPRQESATGTGPVDAVYKAIDRIVGVSAKLDEFSVQSITEGIDAIGEVMVRVESDGMTYVGRGAATDIIVASGKAYVNALNRLIANRDLPQASAAEKVGP